jgi:hypothetical protein
LNAVSPKSRFNGKTAGLARKIPAQEYGSECIQEANGFTYETLEIKRTELLIFELHVKSLINFKIF